MEVVRAEGKRAERLKRAAKVSLRKVVHDTVSSLINTLIGLYCCVRKKTRITTCGAEERAGRARGAAVLRAVRHMAIECHPASTRGAGLRPDGSPEIILSHSATEMRSRLYHVPHAQELG